MKIKYLRIKYLKPAPLGSVGDVQEVPNDQAMVLIRLGIAEEHKPKRNKKSENDAKIDKSE